MGGVVRAVHRAAHTLARQPGRHVMGHHLGRVAACVFGGAGGDGGQRGQQQAVDKVGAQSVRLDKVANAASSQILARQGRASQAVESPGVQRDAAAARCGQFLQWHPRQGPVTHAQVAPAKEGLAIAAGEGGGIAHRLGGHAQLGIEAGQGGVVAGVEHPQRHVHLHAVHRQAAGHQAGPRMALQQRHVVVARQQPGGCEARDAAANDGDIHLHKAPGYQRWCAQAPGR